MPSCALILEPEARPTTARFCINYSTPGNHVTMSLDGNGILKNFLEDVPPLGDVPPSGDVPPLGDVPPYFPLQGNVPEGLIPGPMFLPDSPAPGSGEPPAQRSKLTDDQELFSSCVMEGTLPKFFLNPNYNCPFCGEQITKSAANRIFHYESEDFIKALKSKLGIGGNPGSHESCKNLDSLKEIIKDCRKKKVEDTKFDAEYNAEYNILQLMCYYLFKAYGKRDLEVLRKVAFQAVKDMNKSTSVLSFYFDVPPGTYKIKNGVENVSINTQNGLNDKKLLPVLPIDFGLRVSAFQFV